MRWLTIAATLLVAACSSSPVSGPATSAIPPAPAYLREIEVAPPRERESVLAVTAREQDARIKQNVIICAARRDWERARSGLAGEEVGDGPVCEASTVKEAK